MRKKIERNIENTELFTRQLLTWIKQYNQFILLNSNVNKTEKNLYHSYDVIAACQSVETMKAPPNNCFNALKEFSLKFSDWKFGYMAYDLKNEIEKLDSNNFDGLHFPLIHFFVPKYVFCIKDKLLIIEYLPQFSNEDEIETVYSEICQTDCHEKTVRTSYTINQRVKKKEYTDTVKKIKQHIIKGDIYEMNYCMEFFAENVKIIPEELYLKLNQISPSPFSCFLKIENQYLISSSPERFLAKQNDKIISQPIKGTIRRGIDPLEDERLKKILEQNEKERAENIMIVDLVRNDLSKTAQIGSVQVEELCRIYSFQQVHQMISTITSHYNANKFDIVDVIRNAFPMGSMTGAPKIKAMELIEKYEKTKRGLYSGAVGYITPTHDFDFNVVIRSFQYNSTINYLSYMVGSAITFQSIPDDEYEECLLKAKSIKLLLEDYK